MKVLIIDDEDDLREVAAITLMRVGKMEVIQASNGPDGIARAIAERPDIILLDVMMPEMDGTRTFASLRENPETAPIPVVFLTARAMTGEIDQFKSMGAVGVLTKPFSTRTLSDEVKALAGKE